VGAALLGAGIVDRDGASGSANLGALIDAYHGGSALAISGGVILSAGVLAAVAALCEWRLRKHEGAAGGLHASR
jgi:hypothetical protein